MPLNCQVKRFNFFCFLLKSRVENRILRAICTFHLSDLRNRILTSQIPALFSIVSPESRAHLFFMHRKGWPRVPLLSLERRHIESNSTSVFMKQL